MQVQLNCIHNHTRVYTCVLDCVHESFCWRQITVKKELVIELALITLLHVGQK